MFTPRGPRFDAAAFANADAPTIDDALRQLGLQLQPATGAGEFLVIDHLERSSPDWIARFIGDRTP